MILFLLHLYYPALDLHQTLNFETAFLRALHIILLTAQPVTLSIEDLAVAA
jgi:hypothetical protein